MNTPPTFPPQLHRLSIPVDDGDAAAAVGASAGPAPSPGRPEAPTRPSGVLVLHHPTHLEIHALEGTYRQDGDGWLFSPVMFPTHRLRVKNLVTLSWLTAEAAYATLRPLIERTDVAR